MGAKLALLAAPLLQRREIRPRHMVDDALDDDHLNVEVAGHVRHQLADEVVGGGSESQPFVRTLIPLLIKHISIDRNRCLIYPDNAPANVAGREGHGILEIENSAFGRGGLPLAGSGVGDLAVDQEAAGSVLLNHQTFCLVGPVADRRGRGLRPCGLVARHAQQRACKSQAKCTEREGSVNAFHFPR